MLLRPATPLSLIFLTAFVLLLISTLSTPIIHSIPLGSSQGYNLGVFGYCKGNDCSPIRVGYDSDAFFPGDDADDSTIPSMKRRTLYAVLIVHPIAAFFALVCLCLAVAAHFRGPSHSPRYLLALLILTIPTLLATLLAFLVDILIFVPHLKWGGWIVLAATILIIASSVVVCAMRRTLVSRKARKRRIAENADMNGAEYYESLAQRHALADQLPRAESPPPLGDANPDKTGPSFATFEMRNMETQSRDETSGRRSEDRTPLNPMRDPSVRSASSNGAHRRPYDDNAPPMPLDRQYSSDSFGHGSAARSTRDQYGNVIPGSYSDNPGYMGVNERQRGRGGYGPPNRGRGYGPPRGAYGPPRGGFGPPQMGRGGQYPPRGNFGSRGGPRGPPPPGWNGRGRGGYGPPPPPGQYLRGGMQRPGPPPGYGNIIDQYSAPDGRTPPATNPEHDHLLPDPNMPIGQAVEMDAQTGMVGPNYNVSPVERHLSDGSGHLPHARSPSPVEVEGRRLDITPPAHDMPDHNSYIPPQTQWAQPGAGDVSNNHHDGLSRQISPVHNVPAAGAFPSATHRRGGSEDYYEDMDPRFAIDPASDVGTNDGLPGALTPGGARTAAHRMHSPNHLHPSWNHNPLYAQNTNNPGSGRPGSPPSCERLDMSLDESIPDGARSPGEGSEASHFTSISQRGVNPAWRPGYPAPAGGAAQSSASAVQRRKEDAILSDNPDFSLPGRGTRGGQGSATLPRGAASSPVGFTPAGRYPTEF